MKLDSTHTVNKVLQIIGTRPQFVKCIPELGEVINTGQHYDIDMVDVSRRFDYITIKHQHLYDYIKDKKPKLVVVYCDTKSTLWGAEAANKAGVPIAHIEAGVRDDSAKVENKIRKRVDHLATLNFVPTKSAINNLYNEGLGPKSFLVGDIMYDHYLETRTHAGYAIVTIHRAENAKRDIIDGLMEKTTENHKRVYVFLHHRTKKYFKKWKNKAHLLPPLDHASVLFKLKEAERVYTDSGGLQKEAYWSGVPVTTIGGNPWPEIYMFGYGNAKELIINHVKDFLKKT